MSLPQIRHIGLWDYFESKAVMAQKTQGELLTFPFKASENLDRGPDLGGGLCNDNPLQRV